ATDARERTLARDAHGLERDPLARRLVLGAVDDAHAPGSEEPDDTVRADGVGVVAHRGVAPHATTLVRFERFVIEILEWPDRLTRITRSPNPLYSHFQLSSAPCRNSRWSRASRPPRRARSRNNRPRPPRRRGRGGGSPGPRPAVSTCSAST